MDIFERKPYQEFMHDSQDKKLNRVLGAFDITIMGLGIIIGTGISSSPASVPLNMQVPD